MTKDEERECYMFGTQLAIHCIYSSDNNKSFYELFKSLSKIDQNKILKEFALYRSSLVAGKLLSEINDKETLNMILDYFLSKLSDELKINDINVVHQRIGEYLKIKNVDNTTPHLILQNSGIDISKLDNMVYLYFCSDFFLLNLADNSLGIGDMFKLFKKRSRKNSGCLGSVLSLIFVICFLVYMI